MRIGPPAFPRRKLNPELRARARQRMLDGLPSWRMAMLIGYSQSSDFSSVLHTPLVRATPLQVARLERLADLLDFPRAELFVDEAQP